MSKIIIRKAPIHKRIIIRIKWHASRIHDYYLGWKSDPRYYTYWWLKGLFK